MADSQFSLRALLIATTVVCAALVLCRLIGLFGGVVLFVIAVIGSGRALAQRGAAAQTAVDLVWGIGMPLVCLGLDPIVFQGRTSGPAFVLHRWSITAYTAMGYQMLMLGLWLFGIRRHTVPVSAAWAERHPADNPAMASLPASGMRIGGFFAGTFLIGSLQGLVAGFPLAALALALMLFLGIGLLGFTPLIAAAVYWRRAKEALRHGEHRSWTWTLLGSAVAAGLPLGVWMLLGAVAANINIVL